MQILYVTAMIAISVLCVALFSTSRRVLRSKPAFGGELSLTHLKSAIESYESDVQLNPVDMAMFPPPEREYVEPPSIPENFAVSTVIAPEDEVQEAVLTPEDEVQEAMLTPEDEVQEAVLTPEDEVQEAVLTPEDEVQEAVLTPADEVWEALLTPEPTSAETPESVPSAEIVENQEIVAPVPSTRRARIAAHLPFEYNYLLECLLLGVSIFVLIRTQRSTARSKSAQSSDQVA
ncbi:MAG: hypothetical protein RB191_10620 [Terriglobia bacterium]|nr:hypothetical protein [Terriglobia bacterium]